MAGVDVGGDGSVQWHAWGDNIKPGKEVVKNRGPHGREHQNVDNTDPGGKFRITIKVPIDPTQAATFLTFFNNLTNTPPGSLIYFELPIIDNDTDQIHIEWDSSQSFAHLANVASALRARVPVKKKATKAAKPPDKAKGRTGKKKARKKRR